MALLRARQQPAGTSALAPRDLPQPGKTSKLQADPYRVLCFDAQDRCLLP